MITIEYSPEGIAIADAYADEFVEKLIIIQKLIDEDDHYKSEKPEVEEIVSTSNVIDAARCAVLENGANIRLKFEGQFFYINEHGMLTEPWPYGLCDYSQGWTVKLLKGLKKSRGLKK